MLAVLALAPALFSSFTADHVLFAVGGRSVAESGHVSSPEALTEKIRFSYKRTVVLVVHGGLVSTEGAVETAEAIHPILAADAYPIYVAWETGAGFGLFPPQSPNRKPRFFLDDPAPAATDAEYPLGDAERRLEVNTRSVARSIWGRTKNFSRYTNDPDSAKAAMNRFMAAFVPIWKERGLKVVVIAHSAGAIFTGNWLEAMDRWYPEGKADVLFLAPACTYEFVQRRLEVFERHVNRFRMLALSDAVERDDAVLRLRALPKPVRGWYDASMLYYVSNNLEGPLDVPLLGMERFWRLAQGSPVESERALSDHEKETISEVGRRLKLGQNAVWSNGAKSSGPNASKPGWECRSLSHIGFWTDPATQRTMRAFVKEAGD